MKDVHLILVPFREAGCFVRVRSFDNEHTMEKVEAALQVNSNAGVQVGVSRSNMSSSKSRSRSVGVEVVGV